VSRTDRIRRLTAPLPVVRARLAARPGRSLLVIASVAVAVGLLAGVRGGASVAGQRTVERAVSALPPETRAVRLVALGTPSQSDLRAVDRRATATLRGLAPGRPVATALLTLARIGGVNVSVGAIDHIGSQVRLTSGRLPASCGPSRCEVLRISGKTPDDLRNPGVHLVVVGEATLTSPVAFGSTDNVGANAANRKTAPLLLAGDVAGLLEAPAFAAAYRTLGWAIPLSPGEVRPWDVGSLLERVGRAESALAATGIEFRLVAPDAQLLAARDSGTAADHRLQIVGGEAAALLLAFLLLAATSLRRGFAAEWQRLELRGARAAQLWTFGLAESAAATLPGVLAGWLAGVIATAVLASLAGVPAWGTLRHSVLTPTGFLLAAGCWLLATAVLLVALRPPTVVRVGRVHAADIAGLAALGALLLAASRGSSSGLDSDPDPLVAALPALVSVLAAVTVARGAPPLLRALGRRASRRRLPSRLALVTLARSPGRAAVATGFLVVSLGLCLFAAQYRATLLQGERDEAAYRVPADAVVAENGRLVPPLQDASLRDYTALPGVRTAVPVIRIQGAGPATVAPPPAVQVIGVPAAGLSAVDWREGAGVKPGALAPGAPARLRGITLPGAVSRVTLDVRPAGRLDLALAVRTRSGRFLTVRLRGGAQHLSAVLPADVRGGLLVGLRAGRRAASALSSEHQGAEGTGIPAQSGHLVIGPLRYTGGVITDWHGFVTQGVLASPQPHAGSLLLHYSVVGGAAGILRSPQPTDGRPLPVVVSPDIARLASGDRVRLDVPGRTIQGRIVGVAARFPTVPAGSGFALADATTLSTLLNADAPGTAVPSEVWLDAPDGGDALRRRLADPPFTDLDVRLHVDELRQLEDDPLARGTAITLAAGAGLALLLAAGGLLLATSGGIADDRSMLYDLESQGVGPAVLRAAVRRRSALVAAAGIAGGAVMGLVLARFTVDLVTLSAAAESPYPPLRSTVAVEATALVLAAYVCGAVAAVAIPAWRALREPAPVRPAGELP
jgi:hypothetical protein